MPGYWVLYLVNALLMRLREVNWMDHLNWMSKRRDMTEFFLSPLSFFSKFLILHINLFSFEEFNELLFHIFLRFYWTSRLGLIPLPRVVDLSGKRRVHLILGFDVLFAFIDGVCNRYAPPWLGCLLRGLGLCLWFFNSVEFYGLK